MQKNTSLGIALAKLLAENGYRIFDIKVARDLGASIGLRNEYMKECLYHLKKLGWISSIKRGVYALTPILLEGYSINEFEIAMALVKPSAICCWSALHFHKLTQQIPHKVFVLTTAGSSIPHVKKAKGNIRIINGISYYIITTKAEHFFGIQKVWHGESEIYITDIEKTLLDAIMRPKYCGGFPEVLDAFSMASAKLDFNKLISYAKMLGRSMERRVGWFLDYVQAPNKFITQLSQKEWRGYIKLNSSGSKKGKFNNKWGVRENI